MKRSNVFTFGVRLFNSMSQTADAYFIGRLLGCSGFKEGTFCRWWISIGSHWKLVNGLDKGHTQTDFSNDSSGLSVWSHPIDVYYEFSDVQGWPKLCCEVWEHDDQGRSYLGGYGFASMPMSPGIHKLEIPLWRPSGTFIEDLTTKYLGGSPHLRETSLLSTPTDRFRLKGDTVGTVSADISLILGRTGNFQFEF